jgi:hypothetical protein
MNDAFDICAILVLRSLQTTSTSRDSGVLSLRGAWPSRTITSQHVSTSRQASTTLPASRSPRARQRSRAHRTGTDAWLVDWRAIECTSCDPERIGFGDRQRIGLHDRDPLGDRARGVARGPKVPSTSPAAEPGKSPKRPTEAPPNQPFETPPTSPTPPGAPRSPTQRPLETPPVHPVETEPTQPTPATPGLLAAQRARLRARRRRHSRGAFSALGVA